MKTRTTPDIFVQRRSFVTCVYANDGVSHRLRETPIPFARAVWYTSVAQATSLTGMPPAGNRMISSSLRRTVVSGYSAETTSRQLYFGW